MGLGMRAEIAHKERDNEQELQREQPQMLTEEQRQQMRSEELQRQGMYVHQHTPANQMEQLKTPKKSLQLQKVREHIEKAMPGIYEGIDGVRMASDVNQRALKLHHARGTRFAEKGERVLEFDIAGSGFEQFRVMHKGFHGKKNQIVGEDGQIEEFKEEKKLGFFKRIFSWLPGVRFAEQLEDENKEIREYNRRLMNKYNLKEASNELLEEAQLDRQYGERQYVKQKGEMKHVRAKVSKDGMKKRITMAGPLALDGMSNSGDYSIENLREYMLAMGSDYLEGIFKDWRGTQDAYNINLIIKGHSRGGVACSEGAMMIKKWVRDHYPLYERFVKFDLIQYDPVPGTGSYSDHAMVDHGAKKHKDKNMVPLGDSAETTVIYSVHTDHRFFFDPMKVLGAKRVILTPFTHGVDLGQVDETQKEKHRRAFTDAASGEVYRSSGLNDLDAGVYIVDEHNTLVRMQNYAQAKDIMERMLEEASGQADRHSIILDVVEKWFAAHNKKDN
ncbi:MAG: hypothetical protein Q4C06_07105 [Bacillota bacterium]|nr:hypothetical protein [Bacillota bacterium]